MRPLLLIACLLFSYAAKTQNIGADLSRILELAPAVPGTDSAAIATRDEVISILAYYAGMPDRQRVYRLTEGRELLDHYATNQPMREFLLETGIAPYLEDHYVLDREAYLEPLFAQNRSRFLEAKDGNELFANAPLNLERIRQSVTAPRTEEFSLAAASRTAASNGALTPQDLVSNALVGLSDFIAKRAQAELTYTFLERLREYLNKNDLNYLFPETAGYLPELDLLNYKAILPSIRRAFAQDLNAVSFNLGNFLEARDADSFRNPAIYNIFLIYRILDLELREVPLPDVISFTASEIARSRAAVRSEIDIKLTAGAENSPAYEALIQAFGEYAGAVQELNANVEGELDAIDDDLSLYLDTLAELDMSQELVDAYIEQLFAATTYLTNPKTPLAQSRLSAETALVNNGIVLKWLKGEEAYEYYESYPSFTKFDEFFGPNAEPFDAAARRAAGLSAVRQILATETALEDYREQYAGMTQMRTDLFNLQRAFTDSLTRNRYADDPIQVYGEAVIGKVNDAITNGGEHPALLLLGNLLQDVPTEAEAARAHIRSVETRLEEWLRNNRYVEEKQLPATDLDSRIPASINTTALAYQKLRNAMVTFNRAQVQDDLYKSYQNLTTFETIFGIGQQSFFLLAGDTHDLFIDKEGMSIFQTNASARHLLAGVVQERFNRIEALGEINVAGMITFLLDFSLYLSEINREQKLSMVKVEASGESRPGPSGIQFISGTLDRLLTAPILQKPGFLLDEDDALPAESIADRYGAFRKVPAVNRELGELFELTVDRDYRYAIDNLLNLIQLLDVFPESGRKRQRLERRRHQLMEERRQLIGYELDEEGYELTDELPVAVIDPNLIYTTENDKETYEEELFVVDSAAVLDVERQVKRIDKKLAQFDPVASRKFQANLFKYGTFMSDVVAANTPAGIEAALNNIALPPGSSQVKRTRPSSIEIGAYFGAAVARERLVLPAEETDESFTDPATVVSLFVPVGLSYSRLLGNRSSATLFASILDLGAVTAFRIEDRNGGGSIERLPQFNLRNVVAPGLHLMYNLPRSPFTVGFGIQDGPNVREYRPFGVDEVREARSLRFMLTASVDVPLFRLGGG